jgi:hypothetical protein
MAIVGKRYFNTEARREQARQAILDFHELFPESFLTCGTLLGLIRDGEVIHHDHDADFGTLAWPFKPMPKRKGPFKRWKYLHHRKIVSEVCYIHENGTRVDLFRFFLEGNYRQWVGWGDEFPGHKTVIRKFPKEMFETIIQIEAYGTQLRSISQPERFLELNYGPSWREPDKKWNYQRRPQQALG